jgi:hypothetical protein
MSQSGNILNFDDMWVRLSEGLERIYQGQNIPPNAFMTLYA